MGIAEPAIGALRATRWLHKPAAPAAELLLLNPEPKPTTISEILKCTGKTSVDAEPSMLSFVHEGHAMPPGSRLLIGALQPRTFVSVECLVRESRIVAVGRHSAGIIRRQMRSLSGVGLILGALFFAAALTPTLVPRSYLTQGGLSGACFAIGYGAGVLWRWLWHYLELPEPSPRLRSVTNAFVAIACLVVVIVYLWRAAEWQNSIRAVMNMEPVETAHPIKTCAIALIAFFALLALARLFKLVTHFLSAQIRHFIPRKIANVVGLL